MVFKGLVMMVTTLLKRTTKVGDKTGFSRVALARALVLLVLVSCENVGGKGDDSQSDPGPSDASVPMG
ncbi:MAG: hypothetical protein HN348_24910, partial [Proteobacteria bacterium]|nr:hypothetical protein [Pseudomonadota bacterium]